MINVQQGTYVMRCHPDHTKTSQESGRKGALIAALARLESGLDVQKDLLIPPVIMLTNALSQLPQAEATIERLLRKAQRQKIQDLAPRKAYKDQVRSFMMQYAKCANPTKREAREERVRQSEELGEMEETAINMIQASLNATAKADTPVFITSERLSASQRLGPTPHLQSNSGKSQTSRDTKARERLPATLRLGPPILTDNSNDEGRDSHLVTDAERVPATLRLGSTQPERAEPTNTADPRVVKRKPGRPQDQGKPQINRARRLR
ncbi:hypothetical protein F2Q69_00056740 [Brassica cretica]|uniref:Uncharacterized protein n=1 Tax=Brassica cretica TaxID=69181 RepID=A0A8S9MMC4_BRACR|nr:hypothetical protein F2Q69_00056740 [Brassica cretica]